VAIAILVYSPLGRLLLDFISAQQDLMSVTEGFSLKEVLRPVKAVLKMVVSTFQILGHLQMNLNIQLPDVFSTFLSSFVSWFKFDITFMFKIGCLSDGGYLASILFNVGLVVFVAAVIGLAYCFQIRRLDRKTGLKELFDRFDIDGNGEIDKPTVVKMVHNVAPLATAQEIDALFAHADADASGAIDYDEFLRATKDGDGLDLLSLTKKSALCMIRDTATARIFLLVFLLYPGLTSTIFEAFACRQIGADISVLHVDYSIDCSSPEYTMLYIVSVLFMMLWPIGVPFGLWLAMYKVRMAIASQDEEIIEKFGFVLEDYKTEYWYWEVVELSRKLILSGLISLVNRGSIAQTVLATLISFFFFAFTVRAQPYNSTRLNMLKVFSEFQMFGVLLICVVLQTHAIPSFGAEVVTLDGYGLTQVYMTMAVESFQWR
jgi:hypothetical protein